MNVMDNKMRVAVVNYDGDVNTTIYNEVGGIRELLSPLPKHPDPTNRKHVKRLYAYAAEGLKVEFTDGEEHLYFVGISKDKTICVECTVNGEDWHHFYYERIACTGRAIDFDGNYHDVAVEG